ncbi:GFA family protein [Caulobacter mirabilis]|uniref:GFA family protein n=1 Tax=Caulobacter mirabilis TaxID=69666 RepID=UPI001C0EED96|nr:GFA family protein [Caulobacter mirabilis]
MPTITRTATCSCGALRIACAGEPVRISVCHCLACQRRTGSAFGSAVFFQTADTVVSGESRTWTRVGESGGQAVHHFCPTCGSTVFWRPDFRPDRVGVALGAFADPTMPPPDKQVYAETAHPWVTIEGVTSE